jgi:hypothetical protein
MLLTAIETDPTKTNKINRGEVYILLFVFLIGFALRYYTFDQKSLWLDEIYTYNDARYGLKDQLKYFQEKPNYLQPPLFFLLAHLFYPTTRPERDLRIIPLVFGTLSILMIYLLARSFSPGIALPCTLSLTFMAYHISLSQDGRSYAMLMFFGMAGLYFFMKHLKTSKKRYLLLVALFFAALLHTSYSSIPFMALSQILWLYQVNEEDRQPRFSSFLILNGLILLFCLPWILFLSLNYRGQPMIGHLSRQDIGSFSNILYGVLHDWAPHAPLMIASVILFILFPFSSKFRKNALVLLSVFILPIGGLYLYCKLLNLGHFITSRYFVNFLPLFLITLYLSLKAIEDRFIWLKKSMRLRLLFVILFIASNLVILPFYYRSEKEDFRSLVHYLKGQIRDGDKIIVGTELYIPGMLHYFGIHPEGRLYLIPSRKVSGGETEHIVPLVIQNKEITISYSKTYWHQYVADGNRVWMVVNKTAAKAIKQNSFFVLKGYFDGSFLNFIRFPIDASMYLFIWDPLSAEDKGIEMPID